MLYTMREGHDGIQFYPIRDYNVYIYCKQCKRFVQIPEPAGYIAEVGCIFRGKGRFLRPGEAKIRTFVK